MSDRRTRARILTLGIYATAIILIGVAGLTTARDPVVYEDTIVDTVYLAVPDTILEAVTSILAPRARDTADLREVATIVVAESRRLHLDPRMIASVIRVENPWLIRDTTSSAGAVGIMQVMPFHAGNYGCSGPLDDSEVSVCLGASILREYLEGALRAALLRYNGCSRAYCRGYADRVEENLD